jgi:predicted permease
LAEIGRETQVWLPWDYNSMGQQGRESFTSIKGNLKFIGQLKKELSQNQAEQLLTPLVSDRWQEGVAEMDFFKGWSVVMEVHSVKDVILGRSGSIAIMLLAGVIGLVLIACANISNLFMSRTAEKQRQMAIQTALGATNKHLFKAMFAETSLLMLMSIIVALVFAKSGFYIMQQYLTSVLPLVHELSLNPITLGCAVLITIIFALFFANLSTRMINYRALNTILQSSGKGSGLQVSKKTRQVLIASQVALATVLVFANFSLLKDAVKTINAPVGFITHNISTLLLNFSSTQFPSKEEVIPIMAEIIDKLESLSQVESIAQGNSPLDGFSIKALTKLAANERYTPYFKRIDHRYFNIIEQPLLQGENFTIVDRRDNNNAMIVNQAFAKQLKTDGDVIGMRLSSIGEPDFTIIGIVKDISIPGDTAYGSDDVTTGVPRTYSPNELNEQNLILKLKPGQYVSRQQLGKLLAEVDSRYSVFSFNSADDILTQSLFAEITTALATAVLALITFFLASIGLYGIINYSVQMRRFEIGTRMAIGAKRWDLIRLFIQDNLSAILLGMTVSILFLVVAITVFHTQMSPYLSWQLVPIFLITLGLVACISLIACYLPLRQHINRPAMHSLRGSD